MKKKPISFWIIIILAVCCISPLLFFGIRNGYHKHVFIKMLEESKYVVEEKLPPLLEEEEWVDSVSCKFSADVERVSWSSYYHWTEYCEAIIYVDDEIDQWSDKEQYEFIDDLGDEVGWHIQCIMEEEYPYYWDYNEIYGILRDIYGQCVFRQPEQDVIFKTSKNTYRYLDIDDYYERNGEGIDVSTPDEIPRGTHMPYVGMSESGINSTCLGPPTTMEKCKDFYSLKASHRWTKYKWYEGNIQDLEHLKCIATVWYYDYETKREVPGYVYDVVIYD